MLYWSGHTIAGVEGGMEPSQLRQLGTISRRLTKGLAKKELLDVLLKMPEVRFESRDRYPIPGSRAR